MKQQDPTTLASMFEGGLKKVGPTVLVGFVLVIGTYLAWPDASTKPQEFTPADVMLAGVAHLPDGGKELSPDVEVRPGDVVRVAANVPYSGTVKVIWLEGEHGVQLLPVGKDEPDKTSAGKLVELGEVTVSGDAGTQTWMLSLCPLDAEALSCVVEKSQPMCPSGCLTATMRAHVSR